MKCVNKNLPEVKALASTFGITPDMAAGLIGVWQTANDTDEFPSSVNDFNQKDFINLFIREDNIDNFKQDIITKIIIDADRTPSGGYVIFDKVFKDSHDAWVFLKNYYDANPEAIKAIYAKKLKQFFKKKPLYLTSELIDTEFNNLNADENYNPTDNIDKFNELKELVGEKTAKKVFSIMGYSPLYKDSSMTKQSVLFHQLRLLPGVETIENTVKLRALIHSKYNNSALETLKSPEGEPLLFYHGTNNTFDTIKLNAGIPHKVHNVNGLWFTSSLSNALLYGENIYPAFLFSDNVNYLDAKLPLGDRLRIVESEYINRVFDNKANSAPIVFLKTKDKAVDSFVGETIQAVVRDEGQVYKILPTNNELALYQSYKENLEARNDKEAKRERLTNIFKKYGADGNFATFKPSINTQALINDILRIFPEYEVELEKTSIGHIMVKIENKYVNPFDLSKNKSPIYKQKATKEEQEEAINKKVDRKIATIAEQLEVEIILDETIEDSGQLIAKAEGDGVRPVIVLNPKLLRADTALHEIAHIILDLIDDKELLLQAYEEALSKYPEVVERVSEQYPELLEGDNLMHFVKEVLATILGEKGTEQIQNTSLIKRLWEKIKSLFRDILKKDVSTIDRLLRMTLSPKKYDLDLSEWKYEITRKQKSDITKTFEKEILDIKERFTILKEKYANDPNNQILVDTMTSLLKKMEVLDTLSSLDLYVDQALDKAEKILKRLDKYKEGLKQEDISFFAKALTYINAFNLIEDIDNRIIEYQHINEDEIPKLEELKKKVKESQILYKEVTSKIKVYSKELLAEMMAPFFTKIRNEVREEFEKEFHNQYGGEKNAIKELGKAYESEKIRYINVRMEEVLPEIKEKEKEYLKNLLEVSETELSTASLFLSGAAETNEELIQVVTKLFDYRDFNVKQTVDEKTLRMNALIKEAKESLGVSKTTDLYDYLLEKDKDGNPTGYLVGKYKSSFAKKRKKLYDRIKKLPPKEAKAEVKAFYATKQSYINPQWIEIKKNKELKALHNFLMETLEKSRAYGNLKVVAVKENPTPEMELTHYTYELPVVEKSFAEAISDNGLFKGIGEKVKDLFRYTKMEETELAPEEALGNKTEGKVLDKILHKKVLTDESGKVHKKIPLYFRGKMDKANRSYDLFSIIPLEVYNIENYTNSLTLEHAMSLLEEIYKDREIIRNIGGVTQINVVSGNPTKLKDGRESNNYKKLIDVIETRLYHIYTKNFGEIPLTNQKKIKLNKLNNNLLKFMSATMLGVNGLSGSVNFLISRITNLIEGIGGEFYSVNDILNAKKYINTRGSSILKDLGKEVPEAIPNLVAEKFNIFENFSMLKSKYKEDNLFKKFFKRDSLMFFTTATEYGAQLELLYALLYKEKVYNENTGEWIPLAEAFTKDEKGALTYIEGVTVPKELEFKIAERFKGLSVELHGNYFESNKSLFRKTFLGTHVMMFRRWLVPSAQRRFRGGVKNIFLSRTERQMFYSELLETNREGMYISTARYVTGKILQDLIGMELNIETKWDELTKGEKANIRKTMVELGIAILMYIASSILANLAKDNPDDDDKDTLYLLAYLFRRTGSELSFFLSFDMLDIIATPAATTSLLKKYKDVIVQMFNPTEVYKSGKNRGENKLLIKTGRALPITSQVLRDVREAYNYLEK